MNEQYTAVPGVLWVYYDNTHVIEKYALIRIRRFHGQISYIP